MADEQRPPQAPPGFEIRRYAVSDWPDYLDLDVTNRMEERGLDPSKKEHFLGLRLRRLAKDYGFTAENPPPYPPNQVFVARHESGAYAGHIWLTDRTDPLSGEPVLHVTSIAIRPAFKRKGVARSMMAVAEKMARMRGVPEIRLDVGTDNRPAVRLFESCGFQTRAQRMTKILK